MKKINVKDIQGNPFSMIGDKWILITCGDMSSFNTMTASWGGVGIRWQKPVAECLIRPVRYTYEFMEKNDYYTLSFYGEEHRAALNMFGSKSGRDTDKAALAGFTPRAADCGAVYYEEAELVLVCKKIYWADLLPENFLDEGIERVYPLKDYHREYIGEIIEVLQKE